MHRLVRAAYSQGNPDVTTPTSEEIRDRLTPSIEAGNELFTAIILNVIHDEQDMPDRRIHRSGSRRDVLGIYGFFSDALRAALSANSAAVSAARKERIARNVIAGVHAYGARALERSDPRGFGDAARVLFGQVEVWLGEPTADVVDSGDMRALLRRANLAMLGLAIAKDVSSVVEAARDRRIPSPPDLYDALRKDAFAKDGVISELSTEWLLATEYILREDENIDFIEERSLDFVRLGYMWLIVTAERDGADHSSSHQTLIHEELSDVWRRHRYSFLRAFGHPVSEEYRAMERRCDRIFGAP